MKYSYYKVIQENWGYGGWDDVDFYETDSAYSFRTSEDRALYRENARLYRENSPVPVRTIHRRELNKEAAL
jgi:hypothetical protein